MTNIRRMAFLPAALAALLVLMSGCTGSPRSETIVIPGTADDRMSGANGQPFQVKTIYRLPAPNGQLLGWTGPEAVLGLSRGSAPSLDTSLQLERLSAPYDKAEQLRSVDINTDIFELSPDGRSISGIGKDRSGNFLEDISVADGTSKSAAAPDGMSWKLYSRSLKWSGNSRYVSFLVAGSARGQTNIAAYDTQAGTVKTYPLAGTLRSSGYAQSVVLSDDAGGALIQTEDTVMLAKREGSGYRVQYDHPSGAEQAVWVTNDQFAFLGGDGTLFEYDRRNGELSVLLEKVGSFRISSDRKVIAYTQNEKDTIYAGKLQGNNVLYRNVVYQGIVPLQMHWSPGNDALLIEGWKQYARSEEQSMPSSAAPEAANQPFIIEFR
ncbi:hypothetical protein [Paenibacillus glycinis]|uniref:WD40 repeat domain-containing protein n=1 Tax=Paenibacillus glycinis TaxID=2697035 RepID=A0ABW9XUD5_9BACL|nr:hypothetical protein [Paenibacillus glycinis]NBD26287.1 hypothetical protein [Paenibacillus glycinis]